MKNGGIIGNRDLMNFEMLAMSAFGDKEELFR